MKFEVLLASVLSLTLAACGGGGSGSSGGDAPTGEPPGTAIVAPPVSKVLVDYKAAVLPLFVGTYSGADCAKSTAGGVAGEHGPAIVTVGADGRVETIGVSDSVLKPTVAISLTREFGPGGPIGARYLMSEPPGSRGLEMMLAETPNGGSAASMGALAHSNSLGVYCESPEVAILKTKSIYGALAKIMDSPKRTVSCARGEGALPVTTLVNVVYQVQDGEVRFDDQVYSLTSGLKAELVTVPSDGGLMYVSQGLDGRLLSLGFDRFGNAAAASLQSPGAATGTAYACELQSKG